MRVNQGRGVWAAGSCAASVFAVSHRLVSAGLFTREFKRYSGWISCTQVECVQFVWRKARQRCRFSALRRVGLSRAYCISNSTLDHDLDCGNCHSSPIGTCGMQGAISSVRISAHICQQSNRISAPLLSFSAAPLGISPNSSIALRRCQCFRSGRTVDSTHAKKTGFEHKNDSTKVNQHIAKPRSVTFGASFCVCVNSGR